MSRQQAKFHSVRLKINLGLVAVFVTVMIASLVYTAHSERTLIQHIIERQTQDTADSYFDSVNTLMLTGAMASRDIVRQKILARPEITDARIVRAPAVTRLFGPGEESNQLVDDLDRRALAGEQIVEIGENGDGRLLTVINPMRASADYRGTDCTGCHAAQEGEVLGAVRISYSLAALDAEVTQDLIYSALIYLGVFSAGLGFMMLLLKRVVTGPLDYLRHTFERIESRSDLTQQLKVSSHDEVGLLSQAFNSMLGRFCHSLREVKASSERLDSVSEQITGMAEETARGVMQQHSETDQAATAMTEMTATAQEVAQNTTQTADATGRANEEALSGRKLADQAQQGIGTLKGEVLRAADVIQTLVEQSETIGDVVNVIGEIAEQTNMLALNAAIEAARAGEQGRGFAVVADEVRSLATRTQQSTEEIQQMIETLQGGVSEAVAVMETASQRADEGETLVAESADALVRITDAIGVVNDMNTQIATASEEQRAVVEEVSRNILNINEVAETSEESTQHMTAIADELRQLIVQYSQLVARFKVE